MREEEGEAPHLYDFFPDSISSSSSSKTYLSHLTSLSLDDLLREPSTISIESSAVEAELTNLCYREYTTFTSAHKASTSITTAFDDFSSSLSELLSAAPSLEGECKSFSKESTRSSEERVRVSLVAEHSNKLLEVLEIPLLMDNCVRNGFYQEVIELSDHVKRLFKMHSGNPLIQDIVFEVEEVLQMMRIQLMSLLREPVKLPSLVKAIGYLKKLKTSTEGEEEEEEDNLDLLFLQSRLYNYRTSLSTIDKVDPTRYLRRYIDLFREHIYDIISQFSAIFDISLHLISFASQCVEDLLSVISEYVPKINDSASLSSILVQIGYCAQSFARVGLDFSLLVNQSFLDVTLSGYSKTITLANQELQLKLRGEMVYSGMGIQNYPPIAIYLNSHVNALNSLRLLAPIEIKDQLLSKQDEILKVATRQVVSFLNGCLLTDKSEPSSPRSQLLRRNTETQLTPELRIAKRNQIKKSCLAMAEAWVEVLQTCVNGLNSIYDIDENERRVDREEIDEWIDQHRDRTEIPREEAETQVDGDA